MKRLAIMLISLIAILTIVTGCGSSKESSKDGENKDTLVIGVDDQFAPMGFRDEKNELVGFDIDYAKAAAKEMGMKAKFQPIDWSAKESELSSGRIDLIWNGYTITDERKGKVLFTNPYLANAQVVVTLKDSKITDLAGLAGKQVGIQSQSSAAEALDSNPIKDKIKNVTEFKNNVLALSDLKSGRVDAVVIDEVVIKYYMAKEKDTFKILDETLAPEEYGVGLKKGNEKLLEKLQSALDKMNEDGTATKISEEWFGEDRVLK
ncbi:MULTISPECIES: amino acid ABC transporter substrate-binding protein [Bacillus]|uniref:amino acid ABC transporter substrate-binding protein n=1 Tax=Bacillus TaxID=1386 RepID=UPI0002DDFAD1|nr:MULTISPECIES: amino acid ABC transporter substrate-binding protein [Bacillus]